MIVKVAIVLIVGFCWTVTAVDWLGARLDMRRAREHRERNGLPRAAVRR